jgi:PAS domain S-box-containing protein
VKFSSFFPDLGLRKRERKHAEHQVNARQAQLAGAFAAAPIAVGVCTTDGHWLQFNDAFPVLLGYSRQELMKISLMSLTHPEDALRETKLLRRLVSGDMASYRVQKRVINKGGVYRPLHVSTGIARGSDGQADLLVYVAEQPEAQRESGYDSDRFAAQLLEHLREVAVIRVDTRGIITGWNEGAHRLLGFRRDEVIGKNRRMLYRNHESYTDQPERHLANATTHGRIEFEDWRMRRDGNDLWIRTTITPFAPDGVVKGFVETIAPAAVSDLEEQSRAIAELRTSADEARTRCASVEASLHEANRSAEVSENEIRSLKAALLHEVARRKTAEDELSEARAAALAIVPIAALHEIWTPAVEPQSLAELAPAHEVVAIAEVLPAIPSVVTAPFETESVSAVAIQAEAVWQPLEGKKLLDLLREFAKETRTGVFIASDSVRERAIFFRCGAILSCASDDPAMLFSERLVAEGVITDAQRVRALEVVDETQLAFGRVLLIMDYVTEEELIAALRRKIDVEIGEMCTWEQMLWTFSAHEIGASKLVPMRVRVSDIVRRRQKRERPLFIAAAHGRKYHREDCLAARRITAATRVVFVNERAAKKKGLTACEICSRGDKAATKRLRRVG